jgi:predicted dehydrogenase
VLTIAQIGVGYWGPNILRNLSSSKRCNVKTVVDLSSERRDYVHRLYPGVQVTDNVDSVLQDPDVTGVVIATPVATHFDLATNALNAGKHILVEKPLATRVKEVDEIAALAKAHHRVAMVGHTFLFSPPVRFVKELIDSGVLGDIRYIYSQRLNLGRIRSDVDALWNFAPHDVSIIQYWLNEASPVSVVRHGGAYVQDAIADVVFLNITYPGGVIANIHVSWLDPCRVRSMVIVGSKKMVVYDDTADNKVAIHDKGIDRKPAADGQPPVFDYRSGDVLLPKVDPQEPLRAEIDHFFDCIEKGVPCLTGPEHALKVVQILSTSQAC